jgi:hypothetical protein
VYPAIPPARPRLSQLFHPCSILNSHRSDPVVNCFLTYRPGQPDACRSFGVSESRPRALAELLVTEHSLDGKTPVSALELGVTARTPGPHRAVQSRSATV